MNFGNPIVLVILGVFGAIVGAGVVRHFFSVAARQERRRRRSNTRISSNAKRPSVKFSVRTPKKKD